MLFVLAVFWLIAACSHGSASHAESPHEEASSAIKHHVERGHEILHRQVRTPDEKLQKALDLSDHSRRCNEMFHDQAATKADRTAALQCLREEALPGAHLFAEAASDYTVHGDLQKARAIYWGILKNYTGTAYAEIRQHADRA